MAIVNGGPHHNRSRIRAAFLLGMASAGASIRIETPYFLPGPRFIRAMLRAVRRGVTVEIILPARSDVPLVRLVNRSYYAALLKGGIKVYEREGTILHAKVMLIDSSWAVVGSANLDQRSFHRNYEVSVIVASPEFGRQVEELFSAELACSRPILLVGARAPQLADPLAGVAASAAQLVFVGEQGHGVRRAPFGRIYACRWARTASATWLEALTQSLRPTPKKALPVRKSPGVRAARARKASTRRLWPTVYWGIAWGWRKMRTKSGSALIPMICWRSARTLLQDIAVAEVDGAGIGGTAHHRAQQDLPLRGAIGEDARIPEGAEGGASLFLAMR